MKISFVGKLSDSIIKQKLQKQFMKPKNKKAVFISSVSESHLKVLKCLLSNSRKEFVAREWESISADMDDGKISGRLSALLEKLGYEHSQLIIALSRNQATCRYLKLPSSEDEEIKKISCLQAAKYLPYSADELITGHQIVSVDKEGYSEINLVIIPKDVVKRYEKLFGFVRAGKIKIVLSSYGLCNLYNYLKPEEKEAALIIDIDANQVDLAAVLQKKLLLSRTFKLNRAKPDWQDAFIDEINRTQDAYLKEISRQPLRKLVILDSKGIAEELRELIRTKTNFTVEVLTFEEAVKFSGAPLKEQPEQGISFNSLIGLGLEEVNENLNLLPVETKEVLARACQRKERLRVSLFILGIILLLALGVARDIDNKKRYLNLLKKELNKVAIQAKPLEDLEKRYKLLEVRLSKKPTVLDVLYELHQVVPKEISLTNFIYDDNQVIVRGEAAELNALFAFVAQLENSALLKNLSIKVSYATKKKTALGELIDFEIICSTSRKA